MDQIPSNQKHLTVIQVKFTTLTSKTWSRCTVLPNPTKKNTKEKIPPKQRDLKWLIPITSNHPDTASVFLWRDTNTVGLSQSGSYCHLHIGNVFFFFLLFFFFRAYFRGTAVFTVLYSESRQVTWQTVWEQQVSALIKIKKKNPIKIQQWRKPLVLLKCVAASPVQSYVQVLFFFFFFLRVQRESENDCNGVFCAYEN